MTKLLILLINLYRNTVGLVQPPACKYSPTCSQYMIESINKHGPLVGLWGGLKRLLRCNPWTKHNYSDPVK